MSRLQKSAAVGGVAVALVAGFEGLRTVAYRDPVGIPTICFGETRGVKMGDRSTETKCKAMLAKRLVEFEAGVVACLKNPASVPDGAYVAILSLSYNIGTTAFCNSTIRRKIDAGDIVGACNEFPKWVNARGIRLPGLVKRRDAERALCLKGKL